MIADDKTDVKAFLRFSAEQARSRVAAFILEHGKFYELGPHTFKGRRRAQGMCYMNATRVAIENRSMTYVEGVVTVYGVPIDHAWNVDPEGNTVDTTIRDAEDCRMADYFGVAFSTEYVLAASLKNRVYGLLGYNSRKTIPDLLSGKADWRPK